MRAGAKAAAEAKRVARKAALKRETREEGIRE